MKQHEMTLTRVRLREANGIAKELEPSKMCCKKSNFSRIRLNNCKWLNKMRS